MYSGGAVNQAPDRRHGGGFIVELESGVRFAPLPRYRLAFCWGGEGGSSSHGLQLRCARACLRLAATKRCTRAHSKFSRSPYKGTARGRGAHASGKCVESM